MQFIIRRYLHKSNVFLKQNSRSPTRPLPTDFFQTSLPTLPFPDLQTTLSEFLEQRSTVMKANEYHQLEKVANDFFEKDGKVLNHMLLEEYKHNKRIYGGHQYVDELLRWRKPLSQQTYGCIMMPMDKRDSQLVVASKYLYSLGTVVKTIRDNSYKPVMYKSSPVLEDILLQTPEEYRAQVAKGLGIIPFDMSAYKKAYGGFRLPGYKVDTISVANDSKNVVVIRNGNIFSFDLIKSDGGLLTTAEILMNMETIKQKSVTSSNIPIAVLTGLKRKKWAEYRDHLLINQSNAEILKQIEDAIVVVTLDGKYDIDSRGKFALFGEKPGDRWFDKTAVISIDEPAGFLTLTSHSTEAHSLVGANLHDDVLDVYETVSIASKNASSSPTPIERLAFSVDDKLLEGVELAKSEFNEFHKQYECVHFELDDISRQVISRQYQLSPDSMFHVALQITFIKLVGHAQYNSSVVMSPGFINSHYLCKYSPMKSTVELANMYITRGKADLSAWRLFSQKYVSLLMQIRLGLKAPKTHIYALSNLATITGTGGQFFKNALVEHSAVAAMETTSIPNERVKDMVFTHADDALAFGYLFRNDKFHGCITSSFRKDISPETFKIVFMETLDGLHNCFAKQI